MTFLSDMNLDSEGLVREISKRLRRECEDDECGFWEIIWYLKCGIAEHEEGKARELTMEIVRELLSDPRVRAGNVVGDLSGTEFIDWKMTREETIARIEREWDALDQDPLPGDVVWFTIFPDEQE